MKHIVILLLFAAPELLFAQGYFVDAVRFSNTQPYGSARIQALGGASVALGADPSGLVSNPAGLGLYNRSELSITPAYHFNQTNTSLNGSNANTNFSRFSLDQVSGVLSKSSDGIGGWLGGSWGFGVQKINDFNNSLSYTGPNATNSIIDYFIENADGIPSNELPAIEDAFDLTTLAYYNYLIGPWNVVDTTLPDDEYFSDITSFLRPTLNQNETIETKGSQYQITFGYGGNFADVLYFGINVGLTTLEYESKKTYSEDSFDYSDSDPNYHPLNSFTAQEKLSIDGTGANITLGLIIRPTPFFRIGASVTTPTAYALNDSYETTMGAEWDNFYYEDLIDGDTLLNSTFVESAIVQSSYTLRTPTKYALGTAIFLGKSGFVTFDAEFINYSNIHLESQEFSMQSDNEYLEENYTNEINMRTGVELRLSPLRLRAGYAINAPPVDAQNNLKFTNQAFSSGVGVLFDQFYADFAAIYTIKKSQYSPYLLSDYTEPIVDITQNTIRTVLTLGYKF